MTLFLARFIVIVTLGLTAIAANANTYNVNEVLRGTYTETNLGGGNFSMVYNLSFDSLIAGDATLFSSSRTITFNGLMGAYAPVGFDIDHLSANAKGSGTFVETLNNGDTLFGIVSLAGLDTYTSSVNSGTFSDSVILLFTGGTGIFADATGLGYSNGENNYVNNRFLTNSSGISFLKTNFTITTPDVAPPTATPLPAAAWLFGSSIIGFLGLRRKALT